MSVDCGQVQFRWLDCATPQVGVGCGAGLVREKQTELSSSQSGPGPLIS